MSKNGNRGAKFVRAVDLRDEAVTKLQAGTFNRKARRLLAMELRRNRRRQAKDGDAK